MLQASLYQKGLELTRLKVLSTTTSVPLATSGTCSQGSITGVCIGATKTNASYEILVLQKFGMCLCPAFCSSYHPWLRLCSMQSHACRPEDACTKDSRLRAKDTAEENTDMSCASQAQARPVSPRLPSSFLQCASVEESFCCSFSSPSS